LRPRSSHAAATGRGVDEDRTAARTAPAGLAQKRVTLYLPICHPPCAGPMSAVVADPPIRVRRLTHRRR
jgi:hypothetical protein